MSMQYDCYPEKTHVAAGSVVEDVHGVMKSFKAGDHIFVADKPAWYTIPEDGVKRYDGFDQCFLDRQKRYEEGQKREQSKVSSEAPYDNEYREEEYKVLADFTMARDDDKTFEESDSEIEALRRQTPLFFTPTGNKHQ
ncbi:hypothetical protein AC578_10219 [Pseudocercospora eumusae]|uniref:Uncharacterized protein n=1 Tax=Pseudocercospora eumusae TaxID=321146 RepID=A0A139HZ00_9PEZI|nr:hypothetical protein AC578_10219 [Pseudocercospora eumusae]